MLAKLRWLVSERLSPYLPRTVAALKASYGWKPPLEALPGGKTSIILWLLGLAYFFLRLFWPLQIVKTVLRLRNGATVSIHPGWAEVYLLGSIVAGATAIWCAENSIQLLAPPRWLIGIAVVWKVGDTVTNNLYYLLLRPIFDRTPPHNTYRSLVLSLLGVLECWIWLSLAWYYIGTTNRPIESMTAALYFTTQFLFTGGDGGYSPVGPASQWLAIFTTFTAVAMMVVVLGRAIGIVRAPPANPGPS